MSFNPYREFFERRLRQLPDEGEVVCVSRDVPPEALLAAYPLGIFPWPGDDPERIPWVCPRWRGVLPPQQFRLGRSTRRALARAGFQVTENKAFHEVIHACAKVPGRETWIHPNMIEAYTAAHRLGFASSVEVWRGDALEGGLYGIDLGPVFCGESMFHHAPNAGKAAVAHLVRRLADQAGGLLDIQQLTPHMEAMGAEEWSRAKFREHLKTLHQRLSLSCRERGVLSGFRTPHSDPEPTPASP